MSIGPSATVRRLGSGEHAATRALNRMFAEAFEDLDSYDSAPPSEAYLNRVLARATSFALVAEADGEIIGGLVAYQFERLEQERSELYIYDLAVAGTWRRRGIATALIDQLRRLATECSAWVVFVQADYADPPAIALYEKLGRREEVLHFDIDPL